MQTKDKQTKLLVAGMKRLHKMQLENAFDPVNTESRPTPQQQEVFDDLCDILDPVSGELIPKVQYRMVVAGTQSGKSSLAAREIAWIVQDNHPTWKRPERWGEEPLLILIAGQDRKQMEIELWTKKIKPFLDASEWDEKRVAGILNFVVHKRLGHRIIFLSHNDSSESNRQHMQGYVAHYVWLDEMPRHVSILEELQRRIDSRRGYLIATFTPKFKNEQIRRVIDALEPPIGRKYRLSKLDNPLFEKQREAEIKKLEGYSESFKKTVLYGDWHTGDQAVYHFDAEFSIVDEVEHYSPSWRHVLSVDPALKSKFGFTIWAENPGTGVWYLIRDEYIANIYSPDDMVLEVNKKCRGLNIVKRISDVAPWFTGQAAKFKINFIAIPEKANRKDMLIKQLQAALSSGKLKVAVWCKNFVEEIQSCQWSETSERIINSSSFHILDSAQYFADQIPAYNEENRVMHPDMELRLKNQKRKETERLKKALQNVVGQQTRGITEWGARPMRVNRRY